MNGKGKNAVHKSVALLMAIIMLLSLCPVGVFAETLTYGAWTIVNSETSGEATFGDMGFTYHSPTTTMTGGSSGGKDYVKSNNCNGSASNGIVVTSNKSYCDYTAKADGTLTVYVGNASSKTGYVSKTDKAGTQTAIGSFTPGVEGDYDKEGFKVTQGGSWATLDIEAQKDSTYYITVSGSKMLCYGAEYVNYTLVKGTINDSFNLGSYEIRFTNKETGESKAAQVTGSSYEILLKPGYTYSAALTGTAGANYAFTNDTRLVEVAAAESRNADLTVEKSVSYVASGSISGMAQGYSAEDMELVFVPEDTTSHEEVKATVDTSALTYSAHLVANENYTLKLVGAYDYKLGEEVKITNTDGTAVTKNIALTAVPTYAVSGKLLGLTQVRGKYENLVVTPTAVSFTNVDDKYVYSGTPSQGGYSASLRDGAYLASVTTAEGYTTSTHVTVKGGQASRDLLLKAPAKTVEYKDTLYVGSDREYKSVQAAVDAAASMTRANGERVTIKLDPGTYREQVVVNTPNITLESNGGNRDNTKITWYYGIGYKYYSCVNSCYDPYADYDKFEKGDVVSYWGSAVITNKTAEGFRANGITFENSFNKYMTSEEIADGVEVNGRESIMVVRKENTNVDDRSSTERAAALVNYADRLEFKDCAFIGSQDTLYTCNVAYDSYYRNCYIEGQTDFIYGNGDVIFDGCEINFCGYDGTKAAGYITANSCSEKYMATDGYIFRGCYVSYNDKRDVTPGSLGRMWGDSAKVAFINTQLQEADMILAEGWTAMSGNDPSSAKITLVEYNTTYNGTKVDTASRVKGAVDTIDADRYSVESVFTANGWTPAYYTGDDKTAPTFTKTPAITSNGDINAPNPGETLTINYALDDAHSDEDSSVIAWYRVDADFVQAGTEGKTLDEVLAKATLLKVSSAAGSGTMQIPMAAAGGYIMAVVTPVTTSGITGEAAFVIDLSERPVSSDWSDPSNPGSIAPGSGINIYLAGDSTVKDYSAAGMYNGGKILSAGSWGEYLQCFFNEDYVKVNNYAQGGRAVRSFMNEGKLADIIKNIKAGDYLFMQFGHNDCANGASYYDDRFVPLYTADTKAQTTMGAKYPTANFPTIKPVESMKVDGRYTWDCGATYKGYLQEYIDEALAKGATPVIVTPVARMYYNSDGTIRAHHDATMTDYTPTMDYMTENDAYVTACKELYEENRDKGVLFLDAFEITKNMYEAAYTAGGKAYGEAVMDKGDSTHSNKTGGMIQAGYIAKWIQDAGVSASQYVAQPVTAYGEETSGEYIFTVKNKVFTAKDKDLKEQPYWSKVGQELFDSIGGTVTEPAKAISLNFATDDAMALYTAADTYTDGIYSGEYTNAEGQTFKASVLQSGVNYFQAKYGTKVSPAKAVFSFEAGEAANYTVTFAPSVSTGEETIGLYKDAACSQPFAEAKLADGSVTYKKTSADAEIVYVGSPDAGNVYVKEFTIASVVPKVLSLDFKDSAVMNLYEDETTYENGQFAGTYTNGSGQSFDAVVYKSGIAYYNHQPQYGTKATKGIAVFSFVADEKAMYTLPVSIGTGSGTVNLYSDPECTVSVAEGQAGESIVYKKKTAEAETLYFAASAPSNLYVAQVEITKSELPQEEKITYTGTVTGTEADDTNIAMAMKAATETVNTTVDKFLAEGVSLINGETYEIIAKGDKGVYTGSVITDDSGKLNIVLSRIGLSFPLDFVESYEDYKLYLNTMGYGSGDVTDSYSGITAHLNGIVMTDSYKDRYGVKTNAYNILSFKAEKTGICTVNVDVTAGNADKLILKVNGVYAPVHTNATGMVSMSVMANKGDEIGIYTNTRSNLWYKSIDVVYTEAAFMAEAPVVNGSEALVYGGVSETCLDKLNKVGFYVSKALVSDFAGFEPDSESTVVYDSISYNGNEYTADGNVFGMLLTDAEAGTYYAYTYAEDVNGTKAYSAPVEINVK